MKISPEMRASEAFVTRRALLVPICLCVIAAGHAYRVFACGQTAWKGGGFGMFSTVDAENARYVKVYLTTDQGEVPVELPGELRKKGAELRAAPNQAGTDDLARRIAKLNWCDPQISWSHIANAVQQTSNPITSTALHPTNIDDANPLARPAGSRTTLKTVTAGETNTITPVQQVRVHQVRVHQVRVHQVRVEVWRYRYDATTHVLSPELLFMSQPSREEP